MADDLSRRMQAKIDAMVKAQGNRPLSVQRSPAPGRRSASPAPRPEQVLRPAGPGPQLLEQGETISEPGQPPRPGGGRREPEGVSSRAAPRRRQPGFGTHTESKQEEIRASITGATSWASNTGDRPPRRSLSISPGFGNRTEAKAAEDRKRLESKTGNRFPRRSLSVSPGFGTRAEAKPEESPQTGNRAPRRSRSPSPDRAHRQSGWMDLDYTQLTKSGEKDADVDGADGNPTESQGAFSRPRRLRHLGSVGSLGEKQADPGQGLGRGWERATPPGRANSVRSEPPLQKKASVREQITPAAQGAPPGSKRPHRDSPPPEEPARRADEGAPADHSQGEPFGVKRRRKAGGFTAPSSSPSPQPPALAPAPAPERAAALLESAPTGAPAVKVLPAAAAAQEAAARRELYDKEAAKRQRRCEWFEATRKIIEQKKQSARRSQGQQQPPAPAPLPAPEQPQPELPEPESPAQPLQQELDKAPLRELGAAAQQGSVAAERLQGTEALGALRAQLAEAEAGRDRAEGEAVRSADVAEQRGGEVAELHRQLGALRAQLAEAEAGRDRAEKEAERSTDLAAQRIAQIDRLCDQRDDARLYNEVVLRRALRAEERLEESSRREAEGALQLAQAQQKHKDEIQELAAKVDQSKKETEALLVENGRLAEGKRGAEEAVQHKDKELGRLREQGEQQQQQISELIGCMGRKGQDALQGELRQKVEEVGELRGTLRGADEKREKAEGRAEQLSAQLQISKGAAERAQEALQKTAQQLEKTQDELEEAEESAASAQREAAELRERNEALQEDHSALRGGVDSAMDELAAAFKVDLQGLRESFARDEQGERPEVEWNDIAAHVAELGRAAVPGPLRQAPDDQLEVDIMVGPARVEATVHNPNKEELGFTIRDNGFLKITDEVCCPLAGRLPDGGRNLRLLSVNGWEVPDEETLSTQTFNYMGWARSLNKKYLRLAFTRVDAEEVAHSPF